MALPISLLILKFFPLSLRKRARCRRSASSRLEMSWSKTAGASCRLRVHLFLCCFFSFSSGQYVFSQVVCRGAFLHGNELSKGPNWVLMGNAPSKGVRRGAGRMLKCVAPWVGSCPLRYPWRGAFNGDPHADL